MVSFDSVWSTITHGYDETVKSIRRMAPASLSSEKQFMNATAAALALMVVADGIIEERETLAVVAFIRNLKPVKELNLERETIAFYQKYIDQLSSAGTDKVKLAIEKGMILGDIAIIRSNVAYVTQLRAIINGLIDGRSEPNEIKMRDDILSALA